MLLVGYGTLLLRESLGDTVSKEKAGEKEFIPVIIQDYKRLFNLFPDHYPIEDRMGKGLIENAAANLVSAPGAYYNGLAFKVSQEELEKLDGRERYYKRVQSQGRHFDTGEPLGEVHMYASDPNERWIEPSIDKLLPLWRDIVWARVGAYRISEAFGRMYDETTYLADGTTLMVDYYQDHLEALSVLDFR